MAFFGDIPKPLDSSVPPPSSSILLPINQDILWQSPYIPDPPSWEEVEIHKTVQPDVDDPNWQVLTDLRSDRRFTMPCESSQHDSVVRCDRKITVSRQDTNRVCIRVDVGFVMSTKTKNQKDWYSTKQVLREWSSEVEIPLSSVGSSMKSSEPAVDEHVQGENEVRDADVKQSGTGHQAPPGPTLSCPSQPGSTRSGLFVEDSDSSEDEGAQ